MTARAAAPRRRVFGAGTVSALALFLAGCAGADEAAEVRAAAEPPPVQTAPEIPAGPETGAAPEPAPLPEPEPESESEPAFTPEAAPAAPEGETASAPEAASAPPLLTPAEPATAAVPPEPDWTEADLRGRTAADLKDLLGAPDFERIDPPAAYWRYGGAACALDVFLYAETESAPRLVKHTDVRWTPGAVTGVECLNRLRRAHRGPDTGGTG